MVPLYHGVFWPNNLPILLVYLYWHQRDSRNIYPVTPRMVYWGFKPFSTLVQLYHGDNSLIHDFFRKQTSIWLGSVPYPRALHHERRASTGDRTQDARFQIPDANHSTMKDFSELQERKVIIILFKVTGMTKLRIESAVCRIRCGLSTTTTSWRSLVAEASLQLPKYDNWLLTLSDIWQIWQSYLGKDEGNFHKK